jgi:hypothetical protein
MVPQWRLLFFEIEKNPIFFFIICLKRQPVVLWKKQGTSSSIYRTKYVFEETILSVHLLKKICGIWFHEFVKYEFWFSWRQGLPKVSVTLKLDMFKVFINKWKNLRSIWGKYGLCKKMSNDYCAIMAGGRGGGWGKNSACSKVSC